MCFKFDICVFLVLFTVNKIVYTKSIQDGLILDLTFIINNVIEDNKAEKELYDILSMHSTKADLQLIYYRADFKEDSIEKLKKVAALFTKTLQKYKIDSPKILLNLLDEKWRLDDTNQTEEEDYSGIINIVKSHTPIFTGISIKISKGAGSCVRSLTSRKTFNGISNIRTLLTKDLTTSDLKIGYEADSKYILKCPVHNNSLQGADFIIVNNPPRHHDVLLAESYGLFKKNIENIINSTRNYILNVKTGKTSVPVYIRLNLTSLLNRENLKASKICQDTNRGSNPSCNSTQALDLTGLNKELNKSIKRNQELFAMYISEWLDHQNGAAFILGYPKKEDYNILNNRNDLEWLSSKVSVIPYMPFFSNAIWPNSHHMLVSDAVTSGFSNIMLGKDMWEELSKSGYMKNTLTSRNKCDVTYLKEESQQQPTSEVKIFDQGVHMYEHERKATYVFSYLYYGHTDTYPNGTYVLSNIKKDSSNSENLAPQECNSVKNKNEVCKNTNNCIHHCFLLRSWSTYENCLPNITMRTSGLVWDETVYFTDEESQIVTSDKRSRSKKILRSDMDAFLLARHILKVLKYEFQIYLRITGEYSGDPTNENLGSLYCNEVREKVEQLYDTILTWASINDFVMIIKPHGDKRDLGNPISWEKLKISESGVLKSLTDYAPVFIRRRYNQSKVFGSWVKGTYPCIIKSTSTSLQIINLKHEFAGVTINLKLRNDSKLSADEVRVLLLLAFEKFENIEILLEQNDISILRDTIYNASFSRDLQTNKLQGNKLYIQMENLDSKAKSQMKEISTALQVHHVSTYIFYNLRSHGNIDDMFSSYNGLVYPNCTELADKLVRKKYNLDKKWTSILYLVCETEPYLGSNADETKMQDYFNSHLYLSRLLRHFFPNTQIRFRLHPVFTNTSSDKKIDSLELFISDVNNYAKAYKIHYFLLPAFISEDYGDKYASFWIIQNYTNLADPSVYKGVHKTFFGNITWTPNLVHGRSNERWSTNYSDYYIIAAVFVLIIVIIAITLILAFKIRRKRQRLSPTEINDFLNGCREVLKVATDEIRKDKPFIGNIFDGLVFQNEYEISRHDVNLNMSDVIYKGTFSTIYRTTLADTETIVAAKVPKKTCSKETFKGYLSEVKLLCYIGDHQNVVRFLGCYHKDVRKCLLWIVTEYCEEGSLLEYLRYIRDSEDDHWSVQQLIGFAAEIACGMEHIASQNVIHGNLSLKRVLLDRNFVCKISGFNISRKIQDYQSFMKNNQFEKLPWRWMAPESLRKLEFTKQSDVWSYGVTLWEIFSLGDIPYTGIKLTTEVINNLEKGLRLESPPYATIEIFQVMKECWESQPNNRQEFPKLLEYFADLLPQVQNRNNALSVS